MFRHAAANVVDVHTTGGGAPIGATSNHPFWSEDRHAFVPSGDLQPGERLKTAYQTRLQVTRITPRTGPPVPVFNLEIDAQHVYNVGPDGVLVHNTYTKSIVIGETVDAVKLVAKQFNNARTYQPWKKFFTPALYDEAKSIARNERWIRSKIKQGYRVIDIGLDRTSTVRSPYYQAEKAVLEKMKDKLQFPTLTLPHPFD